MKRLESYSDSTIFLLAFSKPSKSVFTTNWFAIRRNGGLNWVLFQGTFKECFLIGSNEGVVWVIVHSIDPVVMVGGADLGPQELNILPKAVANISSELMAGLIIYWLTALIPSAVIGDLDSLSDAARAAFANLLHHIPEQDTVDFEKALTNVSAPLIYALGFAGGRLGSYPCGFARHGAAP